MSDVVGCFNKRAQKLLELHLATGFKKYYVWCKSKQHHISLIREGRDLVTYALINAIAVRKILKKYDKVESSHLRDSLGFYSINLLLKNQLSVL